MRIAFLTDLHANREALAACLDAVAALGVQRHVFLGDLVGYGADPAWVVDTVRAHVAAGAVCVQGNHDLAAVRGPGPHMHENARRVIAWTQAQLDTAQRDFLAGLPLMHAEDDRCYVHANAWAPAQWEYITGPMEAGRSLRATPQRLSFVGHVHEAALYHGDRVGKVMAFAPTPNVDIPLLAPRRWLALPGSVDSRATATRRLAAPCTTARRARCASCAWPTTWRPPRPRCAPRACPKRWRGAWRAEAEHGRTRTRSRRGH